MVAAHEFSKQTLDLYVQRRGIDLFNLQLAFKTKEATQFSSVGHKLKGNAAIFGFQELEDLGRRLETVETSKDWEIADSLLEELELWYLRQSKK